MALLRTGKRETLEGGDAAAAGVSEPCTFFWQRAFRGADRGVLRRLCGGGLRLPPQEGDHVPRPEAREPDVGRTGICQTGGSTGGNELNELNNIDSGPDIRKCFSCEFVERLSRVHSGSRDRWVAQDQA